MINLNQYCISEEEYQTSPECDTIRYFMGKRLYPLSYTLFMDKVILSPDNRLSIGCWVCKFLYNTGDQTYTYFLAISTHANGDYFVYNAYPAFLQETGLVAFTSNFDGRPIQVPDIYEQDALRIFVNGLLFGLQISQQTDNNWVLK
jgi:hypothetical protein